MKGLRRKIGIFLILIGISLIIGFFSGITGYVVKEPAGKFVGSILGVVFIFIGFILISFKEEGRLEREVIKTRSFEKSLKKHKSEIDRINSAIDKIGTGLGHEEYLKYRNDRSIHTSKGGRIVYNQEGGKIILKEYLPPPKHY